MHTTLKARIRKALYGMMLLWMVFAVLPATQIAQAAPAKRSPDLSRQALSAEGAHLKSQFSKRIEHKKRGE